MTKRHKKNSIWNRLKNAFIVILCLPISGLGSYMVYSSIDFVKEERFLEAGKIIEQNVLDLNNRLEQCENSLIYVAGNYTLQEFLQIDESDYLKVSQESKNIGSLLYNVLLSNHYYKNIKIYADKSFSVMGDLLKSKAEVEDEYWYTQTICTQDICWWYGQDGIYLTRRITTSYPVKTLGVIRVEVKSNLFEESFQIFEEVPVKISLNSQEVLYKDRGWTDGFYSENQQLLPENFRLTYEVNKKYFYPHTAMTLALPMVIIAIVLLLAGIMIRLVLEMLVKEVDYLVETVEEVKLGNFEVEVKPVRSEELNILADSIRDMLERIRQLISKVYQSEIEQKEMELEVLRSKISPHFLYNNLSAINWLAIEREQDDIYEITTQMATFYRTALNKGKRMDTVKLEITNIRAYVSLQLISHDHSFCVEYEIQDDTLEYIIPTFILQPLVENAIEHGIDSLRDEQGKLVIRSYCKDDVLYLEVEDNGKSLFNRIGDTVLGEERYGYGTGNVNRRIQLVYGKNYGLKITASENGTKSQLRLKIDNVGITYAIEKDGM